MAGCVVLWLVMCANFFDLVVKLYAALYSLHDEIHTEVVLCMFLLFSIPLCKEVNAKLM